MSPWIRQRLKALGASGALGGPTSQGADGVVLLPDALAPGGPPAGTDAGHDLLPLAGTDASAQSLPP
jgi:hypothetical protein